MRLSRVQEPRGAACGRRVRTKKPRSGDFVRVRVGESREAAFAAIACVCKSREAAIPSTFAKFRSRFALLGPVRAKSGREGRFETANALFCTEKRLFGPGFPGSGRKTRFSAFRVPFGGGVADLGRHDVVGRGGRAQNAGVSGVVLGRLLLRARPKPCGVPTYARPEVRWSDLRSSKGAPEHPELTQSRPDAPYARSARRARTTVSAMVSARNAATPPNSTR